MSDSGSTLTDQLYKKYGSFKSALGSETEEEDYYDEALYRYVLPRMPKNAEILDLGCGTGRKLESLARLGFSDLTGCDPLLDVTPGQIDGHRSTMQEFLANCAKRFNLIILNDVLEHLEPQEIVSLFRDLEKILHQDGLIYASFPNGSSPLSGLYQNGDLTHKVALNEFSIQQILTLTSFKLQRCYNERAVLRRITGWKRFVASAMNFILVGLLTAISYMAFRRKVFLMPNLIVVIGWAEASRSRETATQV